jgi:hypothetical protein
MILWITPENVLAISGLLWDIVGASILARGLFAATPSAMLLQASSGYGFSTNMLWMFFEQRTDARFGVVILILGFGLQLASALNFQPHPWRGFSVLVGLLALSFVAYLVLREHRIKHGFRKALNIFADRAAPDSEVAKNPQWAEERFLETMKAMRPGSACRAAPSTAE